MRRDAARLVEEGEALVRVLKRLIELRKSPGVVAKKNCSRRQSGRDEHSSVGVGDREKGQRPWSRGLRYGRVGELEWAAMSCCS